VAYFDRRMHDPQPPPQPTRAFDLILTLGSYDSETKAVLRTLRDRLSEGLMGRQTPSLILLVEDVQVYRVDVQSEPLARYILISEREGNLLTIYLVKNSTISDVVQLRIGESTTDAAVESFTSSRLSAVPYRLTVIEKVQNLASSASECFFVRDKEFTRGGEYIELVFLLGVGGIPPSRIVFFRRDGLNISSLLDEILDYYRIVLRVYTSIDGLAESALRLCRVHPS
jgi:hypothetical protein